jgi:heptosyltransferase III
VLALGPTASWRGKEWPAERFAELAGRLTGPGGILPGAPVALFAAPSERSTVKPLLAILPADRTVDLAGTVDLVTAAACLARCALFVGNDSGPMHLAAAAGVPTLGLFGPTPEASYRPWGSHCRTVRGAALADLPSRADFMRSGRATLMDGLSVDMVASAARDLWTAAGPRFGVR